MRQPLARTETYINSFFPFAIRQWNLLSIEAKSKPSLNEFKNFLKKNKSKKLDILYYGERWASVHHARLRIGCSKLNAHLCNNLHVIHSSECDCGHPYEDPKHFFLECPLYADLRVKLDSDVSKISGCNIQTLLYGDNTLSLERNKQIFAAVHEYMKNTK